MGKMLLLSFENSEDDVISEILSILENKQMKICEFYFILSSKKKLCYNTMCCILNT